MAATEKRIYLIDLTFKVEGNIAIDHVPAYLAIQSKGGAHGQ